MEALDNICLMTGVVSVGVGIYVFITKRLIGRDTAKIPQDKISKFLPYETATYILLGLVGVPVFASGGGPGYVLQPTFGYLIGFVLQAWYCGAASRRLSRRSFRKLLAVNGVGMAIVYVIGISYFYFVSNYIIDAPIAVWPVIFYCGILQILPDFLLCVAAAGLAVRLERAGIWVEEHKEALIG